MNTSQHSRRVSPLPVARIDRSDVDAAAADRSAVRHHAHGMTHAEVVDATERVRFDRRRGLFRDESADNSDCGAAEIAEWERIERLLAAGGGTYDPDTDAVVQDESRALAAREAAESEARAVRQHASDRADALMVLLAAGRLDVTEPRAGDEAARDVLAERRDRRVNAVDGWLAQALADHGGHYADPAAREAAVTLLPTSVRTRAALLTALSRTGVPARDSKLAFVARLAQADVAATTALAAWLNAALTSETDDRR